MTAPLLVLAVIVAADLASRGGSGVLSMCAAVPALAVLQRVDRRRYHVIGFVTFVTCVVMAMARWSTDPLASAGGVISVMVVCGAGCLRWPTQLADTRAVADAVQRALLRPLPTRLGPLHLEARYLAAAPQAQVGGDVYDAVSTPYGIRVIVGDVMGNGLGVVETAGHLLGAFREAAHDADTLSSLAWRMHVSLSRRAETGRPDVFATALLLSVSPEGDVARLLSCGHPPPLLLRPDRTVREVEAGRPLPPLGLLDFSADYTEAAVGLEPGDGLLLYTDGFIEARDARGEFFPLAERIAQAGPADLMQYLVDDLARHAGGRLGDDAALVLLRRERAG